MNILIIIPARGGSKGIPRKNIRTLDKKPLIFYSIKNAQNSSYDSDIFVSSDDDEILTLANKFGANTIKRGAHLSEDAITLDPVIFDAYKIAKERKNKDYQIIITLQPTSPLLSPNTLDEAIRRMVEYPQIDTLISGVNDTHLTWRQDEKGGFLPNYEARLNRQQLPPVYKETGAFLITRDTVISENNRIGKQVDLFIIDNPEETIDIDNYSDWNLCEYFLIKKRVVFVVSGYPEIGLGHVYNTLLLANEILEHQIVFLVDKKSELAYNKISSKNYEVYMQKHDSIIEDIKLLKPGIIINDRLDTSFEYMSSLQELDCKVINFEDLGEGVKLADVAINAMYPEKEPYPNHYYGAPYFCLRDEFIYSIRDSSVRKGVTNVLVSFGGVDPSDLTFKVLEAIYEFCIEENIQINVILGMGYLKHDSLKKFEKINLYQNVTNISDYMLEADIAFTSAGRTTFEIASLAIPTIVLCQNEREQTHFFAYPENGFINLGLGQMLSGVVIKNVFKELLQSPERMAFMKDRMLNTDLKRGKNKVVSLIRKTINEI